MTLDSRSTKRRRVSDSPQTIVILPPGQSRKPAKGQEQFTRHADFWLDDGNLILIAGDTAFRLYQGLLTKSSAVFADMFATGSADATETFDGCPVVRLPDHPADLGDFLQCLMPCSEPRLYDGLPVSDFAELHAAIHLAHKYQCSHVETRVLSVLKRYYTPHFTDYVRYSTSKPHMLAPARSAAVAAVNIARLTETVSMLPFALYHVCALEGRMMDGYKRRDGSVEYLSTEDLRLCVGARNILAREMPSLVKTVFQKKPSPRCKTAERCAAALVDLRDDVELNSLGECNVLDSFEDIIETWAAEFELCMACKKEMLDREVTARRELWELLPDVFGMSIKSCGFTSTVE
ncbi:hypothetical protein GSI_12258 [Ganoderma sinense ZZ0214-1]|uniref:BTB domain-containing protein n=1 Tax=Ganoderma sinense ZZ0214-1 TaxID=1077348 RepID=A0A2G8RYA8_9APHY|nr:hypothetical protein GSI_12258 [Ganoderma sinense ZZ0214-1]